MNAITLKALKGSIKKWGKVKEGKEKDKGARNCCLCLVFNNDDHKKPCIGCPVYDMGHEGCDKTPHEEWLEHQEVKHGRNIFCDDMVVECNVCKKIAQKEIDFLKKLLPKNA